MSRVPPLPTVAEAFRRRVDQELRSGNLTHHYAAVLKALQTFRGHGGAIFPSHAAIAERCAASVRTVRRALAMGARLNLVHWLDRHRRVGWRRLRSSNLYFLHVPAAPVMPGQRPPFPRRSTDGQSGRGQDSLSIQARKQALEDMTREASRHGDLLASARARSLERMLRAATERKALNKGAGSARFGQKSARQADQA